MHNPDITFNPLELDKLVGGNSLPKLRKTENYDMPGVYAFRDSDTGEIVYVGKAIRMRNRLMMHWYQSDWLIEWIATGAVPIVDVWFVPADKRAGIERALIDELCPRFNRRLD